MLREMIQCVKKREMDKALSLHLKMLNLGRDIFFLPNPTVTKTCLAKLGLIGPEMRPPMVAPDAEEMKRIEGILAELKALTPVGVV